MILKKIGSAALLGVLIFVQVFWLAETVRIITQAAEFTFNHVLFEIGLLTAMILVIDHIKEIWRPVQKDLQHLPIKSSSRK